MNRVNGILLLIPFLMVRFVLLAILNPQAIQRAAYFAPVQGKERIAYYIYQLSNVGIFFYLFFLKLVIDFSLQFFLGLFFYLAGISLCAITVANFSAHWIILAEERWCIEKFGTIYKEYMKSVMRYI